MLLYLPISFSNAYISQKPDGTNYVSAYVDYLAELCNDSCFDIFVCEREDECIIANDYSFETKEKGFSYIELGISDIDAYSKIEIEVVYGRYNNNCEEHEFRLYRTIEKPTCIKEGIGRYVCKKCGLLYNEPIDETGHSIVIDPAVEPTETETGLTEGSHCSVCGEVIVAQEVVPKKENSGGGSSAHTHIWDDGEVTKEPTCTEEGVMTYTCEICDATKTEAIPAKGHNIVKDPAVAATETTTGLTEGSHCSVCGEVIVKQQVIPVLTPKNGWSKKDGKWYLYKDGYALTGWQMDNGKWYYLNKDGTMHTGWKQLGGKWYYMNSSGAMQTGWRKIAGKWYFFKNSGVMASNEWVNGYWVSRNGAWTYQPRGSWHKNSKGWWYSDTSGWYAKSAWYMIDGVWYYFDGEGYSVTGTVTINGVEYTFDDNGAWVR